MKNKRLWLILIAVSVSFWTAALPALGAPAFPPSSYPVYQGMDVSAWQDTIVWSKVPSSGVQIVYIRATEGSSYVDPKLDDNYKGAKAAGLSIGFYHFLTAKTVPEAQTQAAFFASTLYDRGMTANCRLAMDFGGGGDLDGGKFNEVASAFLSRLKELTGDTPVIYTDAAGAKYRYDKALNVYPIWVANYGVTEPEANGKWASWAGFQYTDRGRIGGVTGNVDLDSFTHEIFAGTDLTPTPTTTPTPTPTPTFTPSPTPTPAVTVRPAASVTQYYQVQAGDTLLSIAARYNVAPQAIAQINSVIPAAGPVAGQIIRIQTSEKAKTGDFASLYLPVSDTSFDYAAKHFYVSEKDLLRANQQPFGGAVKAGQALKIPPVTGRAVISAPDTLIENTYMASPGDTYAGIAATFGLTESELLRINGLKASDTLWPGQLLHLRSFGAPGDSGRFYGAYSVRRGDSLSRIARQFSVTEAALFNANDLRDKSVLVIGQVLVIP